MTKLNLVANNQQEKLVLAYLESNISNYLTNKINNGSPSEKDGKPLINKKTLSGFMKWACNKARSLAEKGANSACVHESIVFGWAIHYFQEDDIIEKLYTLDGQEYKPVPTPKKTPTAPQSTTVTVSKPAPTTAPKNNRFQFSLFDMLDNPTPAPAVPEPPKGNSIWINYQAFQEEHPSAVVAYRLGDFYEVFGENAVLIGNDLDLTITGRDCGLEHRVPMVGFPYHVAEEYFAKILKKHDLYIIEDKDDKQFLEKCETILNRLIDEETGELLPDEEV